MHGWTSLNVNLEIYIWKYIKCEGKGGKKSEKIDWLIAKGIVVVFKFVKTSSVEKWDHFSMHV